LTTETPEKAADAADWRSRARAWAFAIVPLVGLWELGAHVVQTHSVPTESDWNAARDAVAADYKPGDLVVFAPNWADPLGRMYFGEKLAPIANEARPDESRYARAFEVSMRGQHAPELATWTTSASKKVGPFSITTLANPSPAKVLDELVPRVNPSGMSVARADANGEQECKWTHGNASASGLGGGPAIPADRFVCPGGAFAGVSVFFDLASTPRQCIYATPTGSGSALRMKFPGVSFGGSLHGHAGLQYEAERNREGAPITLTVRAGDHAIGKVTHVDGDGWKYFELSTSDLEGQKADLVVEVSSPQSGRQFCFEADTR
jgi:hypothetical protein